MGTFANGVLTRVMAILATIIVLGLNAVLIYQTS
jgi:Mn2+/Fe2+ NRAMP family transporter